MLLYSPVETPPRLRVVRGAGAPAAGGLTLPSLAGSGMITTSSSRVSPPAWLSVVGRKTESPRVTLLSSVALSDSSGVSSAVTGSGHAPSMSVGVRSEVGARYSMPFQSSLTQNVACVVVPMCPLRGPSVMTYFQPGEVREMPRKAAISPVGETPFATRWEGDLTIILHAHG